MRLIEVWHADRLWRSLWIAAETLTSNWAYWLESLQRRQLFFGPCFKWRVRKRNKILTNGHRMSKVPSIPFLSWNVPKISRDHYWSLGPRLNPFWVMGGLPVKSWMKVETYGQTCLNLRPEAGRMAKMFLEPVSLPKYAKMAFSWNGLAFARVHCFRLKVASNCFQIRSVGSKQAWGPATLPLQDPTDQRIMQILRPVLDQECFSMSSVMLCSNLDHYDSSRDCPYGVLLRFLTSRYTYV